MQAFLSLAMSVALATSACGAADSGAAAPDPPADRASDQQLAKATFAGGCFWCMEEPFDELEGVVSTTSGYIGGHQQNPTYRQVSSGGTGHTEAVVVHYDPAEITYEELLEVFWHNIDPLAVNRQFCDSGSQYRSGIFYHDDGQKQSAEASREVLTASGRFDRPIATEITAASEFYVAEDYHQDYYKKNPVRYKMYRTGCGRDRQLELLWGKDAAAH